LPEIAFKQPQDRQRLLQIAQFCAKILSVYGQPFSRVLTPNSSVSLPISIAFQHDNPGIELAVFTDR
jgi:hypothetical protein